MEIAVGGAPRSGEAVCGSDDGVFNHTLGVRRLRRWSEIPSHRSHSEPPRPSRASATATGASVACGSRLRCCAAWVGSTCAGADERRSTATGDGHSAHVESSVVSKRGPAQQLYVGASCRFCDVGLGASSGCRCQPSATMFCHVDHDEPACLCLTNISMIWEAGRSDISAMRHHVGMISLGPCMS